MQSTHEVDYKTSKLEMMHLYLDNVPSSAVITIDITTFSAANVNSNLNVYTNQENADHSPAQNKMLAAEKCGAAAVRFVT